MKHLLIYLLLIFGSVVTGLGATNATKILTPQSVEPPDYHFNTNTFTYNSLGLGSMHKMLDFMTNQVTKISIGVFTDKSGEIYEPGQGFYTRNQDESLIEFMRRTMNIELRRAIKAREYNPNQRFTVAYGLDTVAFLMSEFVGRITFVPKIEGSNYMIPDEAFDFEFQSSQMFISKPEKHLIWWPRIVKAVATIYSPDGTEVIYNGPLKITEERVLNIPRSLITNGYTGTLTVTMNYMHNYESTVYSMSDGSKILYPEYLKPLMGLTVSGGKATVTVSGGAPYSKITLQCFSNLNEPPHEEILTLDNVGATTWTSKTSSSSGFFQLKRTEL